MVFNMKQIFSFNEHTAQFFQDFPEKFGKVFFIDADNCQNLTELEEQYPDIVDAIDTISEKNSNNVNIFEICDILENNQDTPNMSSHTYVSYNEHNCPISTVSIVTYSRKFVENFYSILPFEENTIEEELSAYCQTMLNHEIGHALFDAIVLKQAIVKANVESNKNSAYARAIFEKLSETKKAEFGREVISEAVAESYALIKLHQSHGIDSKIAKRWIANRAKDRFNFPLDTHNFMPAINVVVKAANSGKLDGLSPEDSFFKACKIGVENSLTAEDVFQIADDLKGAYNDASKKRWNIAIKKIKKAIKSTSSMASLNDITYTVDAITELSHYPDNLKDKLRKLSDHARQKKQKLQLPKTFKNS